MDPVSEQFDDVDLWTSPQGRAGPVPLRREARRGVCGVRTVTLVGPRGTCASWCRTHGGLAMVACACDLCDEVLVVAVRTACRVCVICVRACVRTCLSVGGS